MYFFAICDNNQKDLYYMESLLNTFFAYYNIDNYEIYLFNDGQSLIDSSRNFDLIFLETELNDINGVDIAYTYINNKNKQNIIFVTNSTKYYEDGYRVNALRYLTKPISKHALFIDLKNVLRDLIYENHFIYDNPVSRKMIKYKEIIYIEIIGRTSYVHLEKNVYPFNKQLKAWQEELKSFAFVKSHNSYLINLDQVDSIKNNYIVMKNKKKLPISRTYKKELIENIYNR